MLKKCHDAEMRVDYTPGSARIHFFKVERTTIWHYIGFAVAIVLLIASIYFYFACGSSDSSSLFRFENQENKYVPLQTMNSYGIAALAGIMVSVVIIIYCGIVIAYTLMFGDSKYGKKIMRRLARRPKHKTVIPNPSGTIVIHTKRHFFDIVYDEEVRRHLESISLKKSKKRRFYRRLTIKIKGRPKGTLTVKEY